MLNKTEYYYFKTLKTRNSVLSELFRFERSSIWEEFGEKTHN